MSSPYPSPPPHALLAFGLHGPPPVAVGAGRWQCGEVELRPVTASAQAAWIARVMNELRVPGLRISRPVRASDGRWVVGGWSAWHTVRGHPEPRHDQTLEVAARLHQATASLPCPPLIGERDDLFAVADRMAWGETGRSAGAPIAPRPEMGAKLAAEFGEFLLPVSSPSQIVHGDLFGTVLFSEQRDPGVEDLVPHWRPAGWAAGVIVVDALAWGGGDTGLLRRWAHLPEWPQMLLRALRYRLLVNAMHPRATTESLHGLEEAAHHIRAL